jgi:hypothetical protein
VLLIFLGDGREVQLDDGRKAEYRDLYIFSALRGIIMSSGGAGEFEWKEPVSKDLTSQATTMHVFLTRLWPILTAKVSTVLYPASSAPRETRYLLDEHDPCQHLEFCLVSCHPGSCRPEKEVDASADSNFCDVFEDHFWGSYVGVRSVASHRS